MKEADEKNDASIVARKSTIMLVVLLQYGNARRSLTNSTGGAHKRAMFDLFCRIWGRGSGPRGEKMAVACPGVDSQVLATILDPFRVIFDDLGPDRLSAT